MGDQVVERDREASGFEVVPKRWIFERTFGWLRRVQTSETLIEVAMIRLILGRMAGTRPGQREPAKES